MIAKDCMPLSNVEGPWMCRILQSYDLKLVFSSKKKHSFSHGI